MNGDSVADFRFSIFDNINYWGASASPRNGNSFIRVDPWLNGCVLVQALDLNDTVNYGNFSNEQIYFYLGYHGMELCDHNGYFVGTTDKYLGFKFIPNGTARYGWMQVSVANDASWILIRDYAYSTSLIAAGQKFANGTDDHRIDTRLMVIYNENEILIKPDSDMQITAATLTNTVAQTFRLWPDNNMVRILKSEFNPGLYLVRVTASTGDHTIKILVD